MKKIFFLTAFVLLSVMVFSQARRPTIMVVPSDVWCNQNGYTIEFDDDGRKVILPDYQAALQNDPDLLLVISKINELMSDRGFPLQNLESSLRTLREVSAEDAMITSRSGEQVNQSPIDQLKQVARADIWMQVTWTVNKVGPKRSITFNLQGLDAYSNKQVAGASGTGEQSFTAELPVLLEEAVLSHLDNFNAQLQRHFDDMFTNGREVVLRILVWDSFDGDLEEFYGGEELSVIIEDWLFDNTVQGRFSLTHATRTMMLFEQVRIPLFDERDRAIDARRWARDLQRMLSREYNIDSALMMRGLGQAQLVIGER